MVVPFPPGGPTDVLARLFAEQIARAQGLTMVVENRPGASAVIGTEAVSRAAPDGGTLLVASNSFIINPHLRRLTYDALTGFEPICQVVSSPLLIVVNNASPFFTLPDFLTAAFAKPGNLTMASAGTATNPHIVMEMLKRAVNVNLTHVPFPGAAPAVNALLGNHVASVITDYAILAEQLQAGKLRALATASRRRIDHLPDVPTVAEFGYTYYELEGWYGVVAPAKTPKQTVSEIGNWLTAALQVSEVRTKLIGQGLYPIGTCGAEFVDYLHRQWNEYRRVIREANIKSE